MTAWQLSSCFSDDGHLGCPFFTLKSQVNLRTLSSLPPTWWGLEPAPLGLSSIMMTQGTSPSTGITRQCSLYLRPLLLLWSWLTLLAYLSSDRGLSFISLSLKVFGSLVSDLLLGIISFLFFFMHLDNACILFLRLRLNLQPCTLWLIYISNLSYFLTHIFRTLIMKGNYQVLY